MNDIEKAIEQLKDDIDTVNCVYKDTILEKSKEYFIKCYSTAISALENNEQLKRDLATQNEYSERLAERLRATNNLLKKARKKQLNGGWIPVKGRLPDNNEHILLFLKDEKGKTTQVVGYLYHSDNKNFEKLNGEFKAFDGDELMPNFLKKECVIAWQPLPPAYKEVDNE